MKYFFFSIKMFFVAQKNIWKNLIPEKILYISLKNKRKHEKLISQFDLDTIKQIDSRAFPEGLRLFEDCNTIDDLVKRCECFCIEQIYFYHKSDWYILAVRHPGYVVVNSFASNSGRCNEFIIVVTWLFDNFKKDKVKILARESTSYKLLLSFEKRKRIVFLKDKRIVINKEFFHELTLKANNRHM